MNVALTGAASNVYFRAGKLVHLLSVTMQMNKLDNMSVLKRQGEHLGNRAKGGKVGGQLLDGFQQPRSFRVLAPLHCPLQLICAWTRHKMSPGHTL